LEYQYSNFNKTLSIADIIRFTREDKYKFLLVEYVTEAINGFNLCVKIDQTAAINIVKDKTDFTVEGWKIGKEIPTWVLAYDGWVNDVPIHLHGYDTEVTNVNHPLAGNVADMSRHVADDTPCRSNFGQMGPCRRHNFSMLWEFVSARADIY